MGTDRYAESSTRSTQVKQAHSTPYARVPENPNHPFPSIVSEGASSTGFSSRTNPRRPPSINSEKENDCSSHVRNYSNDDDAEENELIVRIDSPSKFSVGQRS